MIEKDNSLLPFAKRLRKEMTPQERKLWYLFLRQYPVKVYKQRIIGPYIADFYCASAKLVIEVDGSQHYPIEGSAHDRERDAYMERLGLRILRFSNYDINRSFSAVCEAIDNAVRAAQEL